MTKKHTPFDRWRDEQREQDEPETTSETTRIEPLWLLRAIPYGEYRQTAWWRQRREAYADTVTAANDCRVCELCGIDDGSIAIANGNETDRDFIRFHVHHKNYDNLGAELDADLALLCSMCHNLVHHPDSASARSWALSAHKTVGHEIATSYMRLTGKEMRW